MNQCQHSLNNWRGFGKETKVRFADRGQYTTPISTINNILTGEEGEATKNKWKVQVHQLGLGAENR